MKTDIERLKEVEQRLLWLACWTVHNANHLREKNQRDVKVGGHQASSASMVSILTALYFNILNPEDRVAVKPHASPVFHAIQYMMGNQTRQNLENFRGLGGAQSYPSRTKDIDDVDFSTGSVGLGVAISAFASITQDYLQEKPWAKERPIGRMVSLIGDAELDEGNIYECLQEGWKHDLRNTWWIIDYNRQSLDGIAHEGLSERVETVFKAFGWEVVRIKYGVLQQAAFAEPGGDALRQWIDNCDNQIYSALTFQGGAAWRARLMNDIADQGDVTALLAKRNDVELAQLMNNLGGQCVETLSNAFSNVKDDKPTAFVAYTIKGWGTPLAGHKDNHAGLMTKAQMGEMQKTMKVPEDQEWDIFATIEDQSGLCEWLDKRSFFAKGMRRFSAPVIKTNGPVMLDDKIQSTQAGFGKILDAMAKSKMPIAERIVTTSPDVTVSTNLGPWVNRNGLFARTEKADTFHDVKIPSMQKWKFSPEGQHIELGIAEMNLFLMLGAAGISHSIFGERLLPIGTVYDPFIQRGLDALNYACYMDSRFMIVGTPSGVTLAPEGGAHQSIGTPLIGMAQDGLAAFEPAYLDELSIIMNWSFDYMQKSGNDDQDERTWLRDESGGAVYLRLSTLAIEQMNNRDSEEFKQGVIDGAYWMRKPGVNCEVVIAYQGVIAPEAITAAGRIGNDRRDIGVMSITSADRLNAGWHAAVRMRKRGYNGAKSHVERMMADIPKHCLLITVIDGHPATLSWIGGVKGHRTIPLGVEHFGQTGSVSDLYRHFGIDADSIVAAVDELSVGRPIALSKVSALN